MDEKITREASVKAVPRPGWTLIGACCVLAMIAAAVTASLWTASGWSPFTIASPGLTRPTIAVLPIHGTDSNPDPLFIEVHDALISALGHTSSLRVIARPSVMRYASGGKLMPEIGRELNADFIVETTASHEGDRIARRHVWCVPLMMRRCGPR